MPMPFTKTILYCPYCGDEDPDWSASEDVVAWDDEKHGTITTFGIRCRDPGCEGRNGFRIIFGFKMDYLTYVDNNYDTLMEEVE